jgi:hypothetical protein
MVCSIDGCTSMHWAGHAREDAERLGWRHFRDGKTPALAIGIAICPRHADRAMEFRPSTKATKGAR